MKTTPFTRTTAPLAVALSLALLTACGGAAAPEAPAPPATATHGMAVEAAATITAADVSRHIGALAHDSMRGRDTPSPELDKAGQYLAAEFRRMGLEPAGDGGSYLHEWEYPVTRLTDVVVRVKGTEAASVYERDYFLLTGQQPRTEAAGFFVGSVTQPRQLPADARGKIVFLDVPVKEVDASFQQGIAAAIQSAMFAGAAGVVAILDPEFPGAMISQIAGAVTGQQLPIPVVGVTDEAGRQLVASAGGDLKAMRAAGQPANLGDAVFEIEAARTEEVHRPANVIAMLPGSDPALRNTYVVMTAHHDHVGVGAADETGDSIFNGADDNASGTSAILEMAEAFASLPTAPARSVIFMLVSGEEKGLLGSMAWAADPTVPLTDVVTNVNMDMIGRNAPDYLIGIGQEYSTLEGVVQRLTEMHPELNLNVILDPKPEEQFFFRSDQLAFIKAGIPAVFLTTGEHEDYHEQSDEPELIDNDKVARVARLAFLIAFDVASSAERPEWTEEGWAKVQEMLRASPF